MTMVIAERRIVGVIQRREEARRIYEQALLAGQTAALLEQERPNIFTQSVGNIGPGQEVNIEISYVDVLRYDVGSYEFQFPMVVGPRYNPGAPIAAPQPNPPELQGKVSPPTPDTTRVPDASRISPPVLKPGVRNGHDITLRVKLDAGVPVQDLTVANHQATIQRDGDRRAYDRAGSGRLAAQQGFRAAVRRDRQEAGDGRAGPHGQAFAGRPAVGRRLLHAHDPAQGRRAADEEPAAGDRVPGRRLRLDVRRSDRQSDRRHAEHAQAVPADRYGPGHHVRQPVVQAVRESRCA